MLHADVMLPKERKDGQKHPMILSIGPYFGSGSQNAPGYDPTGEGPSDRFDDLIEQGEIFQKGYGLIYVDSRGFGSSGGCNDLGGPGEQMDTKAAVEWAAKQPFSTGKVGMWGKSYDAWTQVMALSQKPTLPRVASTSREAAANQSSPGFGNQEERIHRPASTNTAPCSSAQSCSGVFRTGWK